VRTLPQPAGAINRGRSALATGISSMLAASALDRDDARSRPPPAPPPQSFRVRYAFL
jgi:hypothetical protein